MAVQTDVVDRITSSPRRVQPRRMRQTIPRPPRVAPRVVGLPHLPPQANARVRPRPVGVRLARHAGRGSVSFTSWAMNGYLKVNAGDLASAIAFNALVALVPTSLLLVSIAGLFFQDDRVLRTAIFASVWALPSESASHALEGVLEARRNSGWFGTLSLVGFAWIGTSFIACLGRSMNKIYGVRNRRFVHQRLRAFVLIVAFSILLLAASFAAVLPTLFVAQDLSFYFERWVLASGYIQALTYALALVVALGLFMMLYRFIPNAGQKTRDVWPGALTAAVSFVLLVQVFPIYLRTFSPENFYGQAFLLVSLLVTWFYLLAHVLLFGTYVNVTHQHRRRCQAVKPQVVVVEQVVQIRPCGDEAPSGDAGQVA